MSDDYYRHVIREVFSRYKKSTLKMLVHFFVPLFKSDVPEISVDELYEKLKITKPPLLIDIRSVEEYNGGYGHIPNALSIPILDLESKIEELQSYKEREIVTMCPGGGMSLVAVEILTEAGFKKVKSLIGGTDLWHEKGHPLTLSQ